MGERQVDSIAETEPDFGPVPDFGPEPDDAMWAVWAAETEPVEVEALGWLESVETQARWMIAESYARIDDVLRGAAADPVPWCGPDPTADPSWVDARGRSVSEVRADRAGYAVRAAVLEIATTLRVSIGFDGNGTDQWLQIDDVGFEAS